MPLDIKQLNPMNNYVVIGGSSGIGKELVKLLHDNGNTLYSTYNTNYISSKDDLNYQKFNALEDELNLDGFPDKIHGLAYCPGSINLKPFTRFNEHDLLEDFKLQVLGATKVIKQLLPLMYKADQSSIVLFSTVAVQQGFRFHSQVSISKGAIEGLTRSLAAELSPKIRVNAIAPSLTDTPLAGHLLSTEEKKAKHGENNPLKRVGEAVDIAEMASFLFSTKSSWITGQILKVDGGYSVIK